MLSIFARALLESPKAREFAFTLRVVLPEEAVFENDEDLNTVVEDLRGWGSVDVIAVEEVPPGHTLRLDAGPDTVPGGARQCEATTVAGHRCKRAALGASLFCSTHSDVFRRRRS